MQDVVGSTLAERMPWNRQTVVVVEPSNTVKILTEVDPTRRIPHIYTSYETRQQRNMYRFKHLSAGGGEDMIHSLAGLLHRHEAVIQAVTGEPRLRRWKAFRRSTG